VVTSRAHLHTSSGSARFRLVQVVWRWKCFGIELKPTTPSISRRVSELVHLHSDGLWRAAGDEMQIRGTVEQREQTVVVAVCRGWVGGGAGGKWRLWATPDIAACKFRRSAAARPPFVSLALGFFCLTIESIVWCVHNVNTLGAFHSGGWRRLADEAGPPLETFLIR
jgi:hypothetical protein